MKKKQERFLKPTWQKIIVFLIITAVLSLSLTLLLGRPFWYIVESNSMSPIYERGDIVFAKSINYDKISIGDVVVHNCGNMKNWVVMRIISKDTEKRTYTTKGDKNTGLIPCQENLIEDTLRSKVIGKIPYLGYLEFYRISPISLGSVLRVFLIYVFACWVVLIYKRCKNPK